MWAVLFVQPLWTWNAVHAMRKSPPIRIVEQLATFRELFDLIGLITQ